MTDLNRLRVEWGGTTVPGGGVSTFYLTGDMTGVPAAFVTFFTSLASYMQSGTQWTIPGTGDVIYAEDNELTGGWTASGGGVVNASHTGTYGAGVGARIKWSTNAVFNGRRKFGTTFLVPMPAAYYDSDGTIHTDFVTAVNSALTTLVGAVSPDLKVYTRPTSTHGFALSAVSSAQLVDKVSWLTTRRD